MARPTVLNVSAFVSFVALAAVTSGCSNGAPPSDPEDQIAYVQDAISSPSGNVDALSMKNLGALLTKIQATSSIFGVVGSAAKGDCGGSASPGSGTLDVACASGGSATGSISYTLSMDVSSSEVSTMITVTFDNVCNADMSSCVTGEGVMKAEVSQSNGVLTSLAFDATITKDGASSKLFFGEEAGITEGNANVKIVLFDDKYDSYVFVANVGNGTVSTSVEGGNGSFSCNLTEEGGSCSGDASFQF